MKKVLRFIFVSIIAVFVCISGIYLGYVLYSPTENDMNIAARESYTVEAAEVMSERIRPSTKIIYKYHYDDDKTKEYEDVPPEYMIDKTEEEIKNNYKEWTIEEFSENVVIMKKEMERERGEDYKIGEYKGMVAIFYDDGELMESTSKPLKSLPEEEQRKIKDGIEIKSKAELINFMQDYES